MCTKTCKDHCSVGFDLKHSICTQVSRVRQRYYDFILVHSLILKQLDKVVNINKLLMRLKHCSIVFSALTLLLHMHSLVFFVQSSKGYMHNNIKKKIIHNVGSFSHICTLPYDPSIGRQLSRGSRFYLQLSFFCTVCQEFLVMIQK